MFELLDTHSQNAVIKVVGVGGGGGNAVSHMVKSSIEGVDFVCANTDAQALLMGSTLGEKRTFIEGKDLPLEQTIANMTAILADLGMKIEIASWRNIVPHVWSLHIRDAASPMCFTNGKGATKESALCSGRRTGCCTGCSAGSSR